MAFRSRRDDPFEPTGPDSSFVPFDQDYEPVPIPPPPKLKDEDWLRVPSPPPSPQPSPPPAAPSVPAVPVVQPDRPVEARSRPRPVTPQSAREVSLPQPPAPPVLEPGTLSGRLYGDKTTIGSAPWWTSKGWWKVAENGEGNDIRTHVGTFGDLSFAATSLRGHRHRLRGEANQDSYCTGTVKLDDGREFLVVAVSDGMGSAKYSGFGARLAAFGLVQVLKGILERDADSLAWLVRNEGASLLELVVSAATKYRQHEFEAPPGPFAQLSAADLQATLTFAVVPTGSAAGQRRTALVGFVGDSPAFERVAGDWRPLPIDHGKDDGGLWSTSTQGFLSASAFDVAEVSIDAGSALLIATDGVGNFLHFNGQPTAIGIDLAAQWERPVGMLEFVRDVGFEFQSADDDRTAVMIWVGLQQ